MRDKPAIILVVLLIFIAVFAPQIQDIISATGHAVYKGAASDTDGGLNYNISGTTCVGSGFKCLIDYCKADGKTLVEYYPIATLRRGAFRRVISRGFDIASKLYTCPNGCENGACIMPTCTDYDNGLNYNTTGLVLFGNKPYLDSCKDSQIVIEGVCNAEGYQTYEYTCPYGCSYGACKKTDPLCKSTTWTPDINPSNLCSGYKLLQKSNCGYQRTIIGTKTCTKGPCQSNFKVATIYVYEKGTNYSAYGGGYVDTNLSLSVERLQKIARLADSSSQIVGKGFVNFDFDDNIFLLEINPDNKNDHIQFYSQVGYYDDNPVQVLFGWNIAFENVIKEFYKTHPDDYDFINIYTAFPYAANSEYNFNSQTFTFKDQVYSGANYHVGIRSNVRNNLYSMNDNGFTHGSGKKLLGFNLLNQIPFMFSKENLAEFSEDQLICTNIYGIFHELEHQWAVYIGDLWGSNGNLILQGPYGQHWHFGLDTKNDPLGGGSWRDNRDGTFTSLAPEKYCTNPDPKAPLRYYIPQLSNLTLYLIGALNTNQISPILWINSTRPVDFNIGKTLTAYNKYIPIEDITSRYGEVYCYQEEVA